MRKAETPERGVCRACSANGERGCALAFYLRSDVPVASVYFCSASTMEPGTTPGQGQGATLWPLTDSITHKWQNDRKIGRV